jgi:hypothetical protein
MGYPRRNMEDFDTESDLNFVDLVQEDSLEYFNMWSSDSFCDILVKNVATFLFMSEESA